MAMNNPGVSISETLINTTSEDDAVTMPLFIAFTVMPSESVTAMQPVCVASLGLAVALFGSEGTLAYSLRHFFENGGHTCYVLPLGLGEEDTRSRLNALNAQLQSTAVQEAIAADHYTGLLLVPEMSELNDIKDNGDFKRDTLWYQGWLALLELCSQQEQRFALLEMPEEPSQASKLALAIRPFSSDLTKNGAAWWPRLETSYENDVGQTKALQLLSPLPAVAAAIQCNAEERGVWKPPANIQLLKTLRPTKTIFEAQPLLNQTGVGCNLIRSFAGKGVRLWGCRTLLNEEPSPWRYIQTRLLVNSVEVQLRKLSRTFLFEPNNAITWMKIKGQVWTWLRQQWLSGAFYGAIEEDAFTLSIGLNETMSAEDIKLGKMVLLVRLALLAPAEFIDVSLILDMRDGDVTSQNGSL